MEEAHLGEKLKHDKQNRENAHNAVTSKASSATELKKQLGIQTRELQGVDSTLSTFAEALVKNRQQLIAAQHDLALRRNGDTSHTRVCLTLILLQYKTRRYTWL